MNLASASDLATTHFRSDSYIAAFRLAQDEMQSLSPTLAVLAKMDALASRLPTRLTDTTESMLDDRRICRQAVIDVTRASICGEIERVMARLDEVRQSEAHGLYHVDHVLLDEATCAALKARVTLMDNTFRVTMRHLDTARSILANLLVPAELTLNHRQAALCTA